jgi:RNA polymerase sigma-70 factor (ECF subfamily)
MDKGPAMFDSNEVLASLPASGELTVGAIFAGHAARIQRLMRLFLGNDTDAEDVTQQVFLQVMRKLPTFRGASSFATWLNRVAVNAALAFRAARAARRKHEVSELQPEFAEEVNAARAKRYWPDPLAELIAREEREQIERAIGRLPELYRDVFVLADVEEQSNKEIAARLGLNIRAVKTRLHRARLMMRQALAPYFNDAA